MKTEAKNVMDIAWKIFRNENLVYFSIALKRAWKIVKQVRVYIEDSIITVISRSNHKVDLFLESTKVRNGLKFVDSNYNFKLFTYQLTR